MKVKFFKVNNGWCSTLDHKPKDGKWVLTYSNGVCEFMKYSSGQFWLNGWTCHVDWWMYPPKPPKEENF